MDKKTAGLIGAVAGLATMGYAHAATSAGPQPSDAPQVSSYADLLAPIPNAAALMKADDAQRAQQPAPKAAGNVELVQYYYAQPQPAPYYAPAYHHHHHHHHHAYYRHHHHHHHSTFVGVPGVGGVVIGSH